MGEPCLLSRGLVVAVVALWRAPRMITSLLSLHFGYSTKSLWYQKASPQTFAVITKKPGKRRGAIDEPRMRGAAASARVSGQRARSGVRARGEYVSGVTA